MADLEIQVLFPAPSPGLGAAAADPCAEALPARVLHRAQMRQFWDQCEELGIFLII